ncbi:MAG: VWA domain-containing protein, partial [Candidatus Omnitrophota bacterium]
MPGRKKYFDARYQDTYPRAGKGRGSLEEAGALPHLQFGYGLIHHWYYDEEHPDIISPSVLEALRKTREAAKEAYTTHAGTATLQRTADKKMTVTTPLEGTKTFDLPKIGQTRALKWGEVISVTRTEEDKLILTTYRGQHTIKMPDVGEKQKVLINITPSAKEKEVAGEKANQIIRDSIYPVYKELVEESRKMVEQMIKDGAKQQGTPAPGGSALDKEIDKEIDKMTKDANDKLEGKIKKRKDEKDKGKPKKPKPGEKTPKKKPKKDEDKGKGKGKGKEEEKDDKEGKGAGKEKKEGDEGDEKPEEGEEGEGEEGGDEGEDGEPGAEDREGKPGGESRPYKPLKVMDKIRNFARKVVERRLSNYEKYLVMVADEIQKLFGILDNELSKDRKFRYSRGHRQGTKLNMRKASQFKRTRDDKIWEKRTRATKRSYKFVLALDESGSMRGSKSKKAQNAIKCAVLLQEVLSRLDIDFCIIGYSGAPSVHKEFREDFKHTNKDELMGEIEAYYDDGGGNDEYWALDRALKELEVEPSETQIVMFITDGLACTDCGGRDFNKLLVEAAKKRVQVVGVGLGPEAEAVEDIYNPGINAKTPEELVPIIANILIDIIVKKKYTPNCPTTGKEEEREDYLVKQRFGFSFRGLFTGIILMLAVMFGWSKPSRAQEAPRAPPDRKPVPTLTT